MYERDPFGRHLPSTLDLGRAAVVTVAARPPPPGRREAPRIPGTNPQSPAEFHEKHHAGRSADATTTTEGSAMSSTTLTTRSGRILPRSAVTTLVAALAVAAVAVLALLALPDVVGGSAARPTTSVDASDMPTPSWLERYLDPQVTDGGSGDPAALRSTRPTNRGLY